MRLSFLINFIGCIFVIVYAQECKNDKGETVDWILGFKAPILKNPSNIWMRKGLGYITISSKNSTDDWKLSSKSLNDSTSFLGQILAPLYNKSSENLFFIMYNDDPPLTPASNIYAHGKGVVMTDGKKGMWLVHSAPKFPIEPLAVVKVNTTFGPKNRTLRHKYFFPSSAAVFGQSFLCITLPPSEMNKVGLHLQYIRPKIYSSNIPKNLELKFLNLTDAAKKKYISKPPWFQKFNLTSKKGTKFVSYAKTKEFNKDLYADWLAKDLESDLMVETWSNGANELPSNCNGKYDVMDIKNLKIKTSDNYTIQYKNSQDHSKWVVTLKSDSNTTCVGDINRMLAQYRRGGGTVCFQNNKVWQKFSKAIDEVQPCSRFDGLFLNNIKNLFN